MGLRMKMSFTYVNNIFLTTIREMRYCTNKISSQDEVDMIQTYAGDLDILYDDLSTNDILFVLMFHYYSLNLSEHYAPEFSLFDFKDYIDDYDTSTALLFGLICHGDTGSLSSNIRRSFFGMKT
jgi:hypothetical protein